MFAPARLLACLLLTLPPLSASAEERGAVFDVRLGEHPDRTRIVLDMSAAPQYRVFVLADPYRLVIDLAEVDWRLPTGRTPVGRGLVEALRYGLFSPGISRIVLDLKAAARVERLEVLPGEGGLPVRLLIDVAPVRPATFQAALAAGPIVSSPAMAPAPAALPTPPLKPGDKPENPVPVVAIDAGHGGVDPGAIGQRGTAEKDIALAYALELARRLETGGRYRVVLTRARDLFVRLRDRIAIARAAGADLFISLHADAHDTPALRGASVYTLSEQASDAEAAALAAKENKADLIAGVDLSGESEVVANILIDLAQRETKNLSARFAAMLVKELKKDTPLLRNSHRFAGFAVLKAPDVPSLLVELGYLSSRQDEALLRSADGRARLAAALGRAIDAYFAWRADLKRS